MTRANAELHFTELWKQATEIAGGEPVPYQVQLALGEPLPTLLDAPTGLGKTAAAVLGWLWRWRFADEKIRTQTPRRLVYCLPMRVLVEQTYVETLRWLTRLGILAGEVHWDDLGDDGLPTRESRLVISDEAKARVAAYTPQPDAPTPTTGWAVANGDHGTAPIAVHLLMGGIERTDWAIWPERDAILIGTQDMLLSRALNRGYAAGRARWPLEFGFLNNDSLWVFDEVQLMSTGLATSLQLDAWRRQLRLRDKASSFPEPVNDPVSKGCHSLWMSATITQHWLSSAIDWQSLDADGEAWKNRLKLGRHQLEPGTEVDDFTNDHVNALFANKKQLRHEAVAKLDKPKGKSGKCDHRKYVKQLSNVIIDNRSQEGLTLIIANTVDRAVGIYDELQSRNIAGSELHLIHSRFRPMEREAWSDFLRADATKPAIIVSTQVVEAGVDLSAEVLFTELAPWASLVQRFGRCARYPGEMGYVYWMDLDLGSEKQPSPAAGLPYEVPELTAARQRLERLKDAGDVGLQTLSMVKKDIDSRPDEARDLFPYNPKLVPREKDLFDLFDTTPDLSGADVDISRFIREGEELDVQVFWRKAAPEPDFQPPKRTRPDRRELCPVPTNRFRREARDLGRRGRIWRWDYRQGWLRLSMSDDEKIFAGQVFLLEDSCGGYDHVRGWTGHPNDSDFDVLDNQKVSRTQPKSIAEGEEDDADDQSSCSKWLSVLEHTKDVCRELKSIVAPLTIPPEQKAILALASRWHDRGKAHSAFQAKIYEPVGALERLGSQPMAKAPNDQWRGPIITKSEKRAARPGTYPTEATPGDQQAAAAGYLRRPGHRHELASALALLETLRLGCPQHEALQWPEGLREFLPEESSWEGHSSRLSSPLIDEIGGLKSEDFNLMLYLVAAHHGKVRMSLRSAPEDAKREVPDPCPADCRQARGVRDGDPLPACTIPAVDLSAEGIEAPEVTLCLDPMEIGLSHHYGPSWRERTERLLESLGPFRLAYLESLLRAADSRASRNEDRPQSPSEQEA